MSITFLSGENIILSVPAEDDFPQWASWFNDCRITKYLEQGKLPNTLEMQKEFYNEAVRSGRLLLMIKTKSMKLLGVISLSEISYEKSCCQISLVCPEKTKEAPLAALEAMSLLTDHAFQRLGVTRVHAGQAYPGLLSWTQQLEVIGYKTEGCKRNSFKHGMTEGNSVIISIVKSDYFTLISRRNNSLWLGTKLARRLIKELKKTPSLAEELNDFIRVRYDEFDKKLEKLEEQIKLDI